jgi:hypothetical protein
VVRRSGARVEQRGHEMTDAALRLPTRTESNTNAARAYFRCAPP